MILIFDMIIKKKYVDANELIFSKYLIYNKKHPQNHGTREEAEVREDQ